MAYKLIRQRPALVLVVLALLAGSGPTAGWASEGVGAPRATPSKVKGADIITAEHLREYLAFLAADAMAGRDTPSNGLDIAANFLALELEEWGLKPAGDDGTFFQNIAMTRRTLDVPKTTARLGDRTLAYGDDFLVNTIVPATVEGRLVYAGSGYVVKARNIDSYKGLDVKGKILVVQTGLPSNIQRSDIPGQPGPDTWESPASYAARHGATGLIYLPAFDSLTGWSRNKERAVERGTLTVDKLAPRQPVVPAILASPQLVAGLFAGEKLAGAEVFRHAVSREPGESFELSPEKTVRFTIATVNAALATRNVVAIHEGSDPVLKDEYVALGAHYDHVGVRPGRPGDAIFNGADDNGSGTSAILTMAEAYARGGARPKRSILFVWHTGEEIGLIGSDYFTRFPTVPLEKIVAQLNIDMIGRSKAPNDAKPANRDLAGPNELYVIGSRMMSTQLGELSDRVNKSFLNLSFNYKFDDPKDPNRFFFRSDHYHYAKNGVPIIVYFTGVHEDYHGPGDSVDKIDFAKLEKIARTIYATSLAIADAPERPKIDKKLPTELSQR